MNNILGSSKYWEGIVASCWSSLNLTDEASREKQSGKLRELYSTLPVKMAHSQGEQNERLSCPHKDHSVLRSNYFEKSWLYSLFCNI